ncbi:hypothetical protein OBBRIDRAFT_858963 [Obba rivulosa]|uniref:Uncharacterized protein n=1 Tax=Obba rivulosa TaxID=1052685 RepID=A0A8E2DPS8_9APHY|nr:hypothetical protein OBBRIDRAFT_858963 [Obba rivulosa]
MPHGWPPKRPRNISGLRNQAERASTASVQSPSLRYSNIEASADSASSEDDLDADLSWTPGLVHDSLKVDYQLKDGDVDVEEESDWEELDNEDFFEMMIEFARDAGDDPRDKDWAPETRQSASKQS